MSSRVRRVSVKLVLLAVLIAAAPASAATPTATEFSGISPFANVSGIATGPDGNIWFTEPSLSAVGRITPSGTVTEFSTGISTNSQPSGISAGPDGNLWFAESSGDRIGRITPTGTVTEFSTGITLGAGPTNITRGLDGNLWFTENSDRIGRITPAGAITEFSAGVPAGSVPRDITAGSDGNLWFTEIGRAKIGRITPTGTVTEFGIGSSVNNNPGSITAGPDGNLWFTESQGARIGRIAPTGDVTEFSTGITSGSIPADIVAGPDGNLWFTEVGGSRIGRITPSGVVTEFSAGITPGTSPRGITAGPDGNLWFTSNGAVDRIGRINTAQDAPRFSNPAAIAIPGAGTAGPASAYPSPIAVSGLEGTVTDVRVRLTGLEHSFPADVGALLVGPAGQRVVLAVNRGGQVGAYGVTLNLSDSAPYRLPPSSPLVSGIYLPEGDTTVTSFSPPAPAAPYATKLSAFDGTAPNGTWQLYLDDDGIGDIGALRGGWGLDIDTTGPGPITPPPADPFELTLSAKPTQKVTKLKVRATCSKACDLSAVAKGKAGEKFKTKPVKGKGAAGVAVTLKPKLAKSILKKIDGETGKATFKVTATDSSGATDTESVKLKLK